MTDEIHYLDLVDFLLLAEAVLGVDARELTFAANLGTGRPRVPASIAFVGGPMPRFLGNLEKIAMAIHAQERPA